MDPVAVRWESLGLIAGAIALCGWALIDAASRPASVADETSKPLALEVHRPGDRAVVIGFEDGALIGRAPHCRIILHDATVSKEHARLHVEGSKAAIEDLHSTNGTLVNGKAIEGLTPLKPGDRIGFGANVIWFLGEMP
jgi:pSer/pThr/pTyr-binding forkhead associated (FHA) protein